MEILVAGGTGFIGTRLCSELANRGHEVTALARHPEDDVPEGVEVAVGDVTAYDSIEGHVADHDAVVNLVALSPLFRPSGGEEMHEKVHLGGTENLVEAAESSGVERYLQMSALGADPDGPTHYIRAKGKAERVVRDSDLDWAIARPSIVFGEGGELVSFTKRLKKLFAPGLPIYPIPGGGETPFQPIWAGDLLPMLAEMLAADEHVGEIYELGGPEVLTLRRISELVFAAEGKSVRVVSLPTGLAKVGATVMSPVPGFPFGPDQLRSLDMDNTVADNDVTVFGVEESDLQTFESYLGVE